MARPKTFFVPNISPSLPPGTLGRPSHKMSLISRPCNSLASTSTCLQKGYIFLMMTPSIEYCTVFITRGFFFKANLHDNITNEEGRFDTLLLVQSPSNLGPTPLLRTWKRQHSDATFAFQIIFEYLKKSKGCNYSLCHVLNCHVDVDPKHVVCDEANEDKNGNMNPPNQMLCDMLLMIMAFRRILNNRQFPNLGSSKIGT